MSEYIPRLREELVAAAARERAGQRPRRQIVRPRRIVIAAAVAVALAAFVLAVGSIDRPHDERPVAPAPPTSGLTFDVQPAAGATPADAAAEAAQVLRARLAAAGVAGATVTVSGERIAVEVARAADRERVAALAQPGRLVIQDWEATVLGPDGSSARPDARLPRPVSRAEAMRRAEKATTDARVVRAPAYGLDGWYALAVRPALGNAQIASAQAATDPRTGEPIAAFELTAAGREAFHQLTRGIAQRGADAHRPGDDPVVNAHHLVIVLDDRIASIPFINYAEVPDGIDGTRGVHIAGGLTEQRARDIAVILDSGPLPATLVPAERAP
jgi:SecD/SecF fusion protein